jgi:hypothetical protein
MFALPRAELIGRNVKDIVYRSCFCLSLLERR